MLLISALFCLLLHTQLFTFNYSLKVWEASADNSTKICTQKSELSALNTVVYTYNVNCKDLRIPIELKAGVTYKLTIQNALLNEGITIKTISVKSSIQQMFNFYNTTKYVGGSFYFRPAADYDECIVYTELVLNGANPIGSTITIKVESLNLTYIQKNSGNTNNPSLSDSCKDYKNIKKSIVNSNISDKAAALYNNLLNNDDKIIFGSWRNSSHCYAVDGNFLDYRVYKDNLEGSVLAAWNDDTHRAEVRLLPAKINGVTYNIVDEIGRLSSKSSGSTEEDLAWSVYEEYDSEIDNPNNDYYKLAQIERYSCISALLNFYRAKKNNGMVGYMCHFLNPYKKYEAPNLDLGGMDYRYISPNHVNLMREILDGTTILHDDVTLKQWYDNILSQICDIINLTVDDNGNKIPVTLRLFHEFDCPYFWWGANYNSAEDYVSLFKYTVDYVKSRCNNVLFVWCPEKFWAKISEDDIILNSYYPGDSYVDIVSYDDYTIFNETYDFNIPKRLEQFASFHGKPFGISEMGFTSKDSGTSQQKIDNGIYDILYYNLVKSGVKPAFMNIYSPLNLPYRYSDSFADFVNCKMILDLREKNMYDLKRR